MKQMARIVIVMVIAFAAMTVFAAAQQKPAAALPANAPQLSTSDKIAIQSLEKQKQDAAAAWQNAQQQELSILREWTQAHPGFHLHFNSQNAQDPQNFAVEADTPVPAPKPAAPPAAKK
jgi:hypothetical protein